MKRIAVIRVRGQTGIPRETRDTLKMLHITRVNHCSITTDAPQYAGMVRACKDYITWGEPDEKTFSLLLQKRGRLVGDKKLSDKDLEGVAVSFDDFARKFLAGECELSAIKGLKPVFRLNAPSKGYEGIKRQYPRGALGNRGKEINELIKRMM